MDYYVIVINKRLIVLLLILFSLKLCCQNDVLDYKIDKEIIRNFSFENMSSDGNWLYGKIMYSDTIDTLYLINSSENQHYYYPLGYKPNFSKNEKFFTFLNTDKLCIKNLTTKEFKQLNRITNYEITDFEDEFILESQKNNQKKIALFNLSSNLSKKLNWIKEWRLTEDGKSIIAIQNGKWTKILFWDLKFKKPIIVDKTNKTFTLSNYNTDSGILVYWETLKTNSQKLSKLHVVKTDHHSKKYTLDSEAIHKRFNASFFMTDIHISKDTNKVFFYILPNKDEKNEEKNITIWTADATTIKPGNDKKDFSIWGKWMCWHLEEGTLIELETEDNPNVLLSGDDNNLLILDKSNYSNERDEGKKRMDIYVRNLNSHEIFLGISNQPVTGYDTKISPSGKFIAYFKDKNWWLLNLFDRKHTCVTCHLNSEFENIDFDKSGVKEPFGFEGWYEDDKMIIYDQNDIWIINPVLNQTKCLTASLAKNSVFRIKNSLPFKPKNSIESLFVSTYFQKQTPLIISELDLDSGNEGLWVSFNGLNPEKMTTTVGRFNTIKTSDNGHKIAFIESAVQYPERLKTLNCFTKNTETVLKSRTQDFTIKRGVVQRICSEAENGTKIWGNLYYPALFDENKIYPVITHIYELQSNKHLEFTPLKLSNYNGFNIPLYTSQGYFVFMPDIVYKLNQPGDSALKCINILLDEVKKLPFIDSNNMGLIGHSFGGYQINYIVSKTNQFKAAVSGCSVSDILDSYLSIDHSNRGNWLKFENGQSRITVPFYSDIFSHNNPILYSNKIETPLLLWIGNKDSNVNPNQSIKFFNALWKQNKDVTLLEYQNEGHIISNEDNQIDLSIRIMDFFNHHLKNKPRPKWLNIKQK